MEDGVTEVEKSLVFDPKKMDANGVEEIGDKRKEEDEEKPSGFISQLISNLVPVGSEKEEEEKKDSVENGGGDDKEKEEGLFSHIISNLVSPSSTPGVKEFDEDDLSTSSGSAVNVDENIQGEEEKQHNEQEQSENTGNSGGIIGNIVSHLPTPLTEDAAPEPDEASILIHSIVRD